jgi:hypothetical protein
LDKAGIDVWGWHVPFCTDRDAAKAEASNVLKLVISTRSTVLIDAESAPKSPRFHGGAAKAGGDPR